MRKLILVAIALFGLVGVATVASADEPADLNRAWFFGDCENEPVVVASSLSDGCRGFGIFFGHFDAESLADAIEDEAWDEFEEDSVVLKLYAFKVGGGGTQFVPPIIGGMGGEYGHCDYDSVTETVETQNTVEGPDITGGLWIAWFEIEICDDFYDG